MIEPEYRSAAEPDAGTEKRPPKTATTAIAAGNTTRMVMPARPAIRERASELAAIERIICPAPWPIRLTQGFRLETIKAIHIQAMAYLCGKYCL